MIYIAGVLVIWALSLAYVERHRRQLLEVEVARLNPSSSDMAAFKAFLGAELIYVKHYDEPTKVYLGGDEPKVVDAGRVEVLYFAEHGKAK